ncbi:uncharacterized protein si:dkey-30c15.2 [Megalops cyprinoides]|uniref:uncharacterized protein si:dkey-30c15.2 n=1 Tax=Megalops cyprinoides TaxID=118141 RepID=UPI0018653CA7|nr:uncharacterized protein si:dkey-30c15.2 [Megalops cyprinoides]
MNLRDGAGNQSALTENQIKTLSIVYATTLSLSLVGSSSVVVVSIIKRRYLNEQAQLLFQLALADFLAAAVLLCVSAMSLAEPQQHPDRFKLCTYGLPLTLTFYCVSFVLVTVYAYRSKQAVEGWRESSDTADAGQVIYCQVGRWHREYTQRHQRMAEGGGAGRRRLWGLGSTPRSLVLVLIVCWTPACILVGLSCVGQISQDRLFFLYVIQALMVSLQGLLYSAVYGRLQRNFREAALRERLPLLAASPRPFYDESLLGPP